MKIKTPTLDHSRGVKTIHRVLDLIKILQEHPYGLTLAELSAYLNLPKSSVHRMLNALVERQFARESATPGKYVLGYEILKLSVAYLKGLDLYREARPKLEELNRKLDETVILGVLDQTKRQIIYLDKLDTSKSIRLGSHVGETAPIHCTALGKALLSGFRDDLVKSILEDYPFTKYTEQTIVDREVFLNELVEIRKRGYSIDLQEYRSHIVCAAAPIFNYQGEPIAAVSVSAPSHRIEASRLDVVARMVLETAKEISKALAHTATA